MAGTETVGFILLAGLVGKGVLLLCIRRLGALGSTHGLRLEGALGVIVLVSGENDPGDAKHLVRKRHGGDVFAASLDQAAQP